MEGQRISREEIKNELYVTYNKINYHAECLKSLASIAARLNNHENLTNTEIYRILSLIENISISIEQQCERLDELEITI